MRRIDAENDALYLLRVKLFGWMPGSNYKIPLSAYLHRFYLPDQDRALHNHPWRWAFSIVLSGGYTEERMLADGRTITRRLRPGNVNLLTSSTYHRVLELHGEPWTLFVTGKKTQSWGFLIDGIHVPWRERLRQRGIEPSY